MKLESSNIKIKLPKTAKISNVFSYKTKNGFRETSTVLEGETNKFMICSNCSWMTLPQLCPKLDLKTTCFLLSCQKGIWGEFSFAPPPLHLHCGSPFWVNLVSKIETSLLQIWVGEQRKALRAFVLNKKWHRLQAVNCYHAVYSCKKQVWSYNNDFGNTVKLLGKCYSVSQYIMLNLAQIVNMHGSSSESV